MNDLERRVQHLITQPWSSLEAARAIIPMVLEHADSRAKELRYKDEDVTDSETAAFNDGINAARNAIRAIGAP